MLIGTGHGFDIVAWDDDSDNTGRGPSSAGWGKGSGTMIRDAEATNKMRGSDSMMCWTASQNSLARNR
uniref:Bm9674, isoform a n=1 Tax=Brugia malayi TaxID=6279 RepID=A0A1I9GF31_BRUMA|nr:Bm9674, isoform a [Brugia malayi]